MLVPKQSRAGPPRSPPPGKSPTTRCWIRLKQPRLRRGRFAPRLVARPTKISIEATGDVPGLSEDEFKAKAEEAKGACLIARALAAVPEITLKATLAV
jgi:hypothetical protein